MTTKASPFVMTKAFPLEKSEIQYNPTSQEVSLNREKFDAFVKYVQELEEKLETAEDARDIAEYRARKEGKTADVLQALAEDVAHGTAAVRAWLSLPGHTLQELSLRSGIPYATCHRIANERLGTPNLEIGHLQRMVAAVSKGQRPFSTRAERHPRFKRVLLGLPKGFRDEDLVASWQMNGSEVSTAHGGVEIIEKVKELHPNLILLDVSMPNLEMSGLERLKEFAKDKKNTIILMTGAIAEANSALVQCSVEKKKNTEELAMGGEAAGG